MEEFDDLKIENQICFPLYACSKEIIKKYKPLLDKYDLTYTQYLVMMIMWDKKQINVKELGKCLYLDSGTLTPVLKKLENKGYVERNRSEEDERNLIVSISKKGEGLKKDIKEVPTKMGESLVLTIDEVGTLYKILYKILGQVEEG